jgi:hypothetical protein
VAVLTSPDGLSGDDLRFTSGLRLTPVFGINVGHRRTSSELPAIGTPEHTALLSGEIDLTALERAARISEPLVGFAPIVLDPAGPEGIGPSSEFFIDSRPGSTQAPRILPSRRSLRASSTGMPGQPLSDDLLGGRTALPNPRGGGTGPLPPRISAPLTTGALQLRQVQEALAERAVPVTEDPTPTGELARPFVTEPFVTEPVVTGPFAIETGLCDWDADAVPPPISVDEFQRAVRAGLDPDAIGRVDEDADDEAEAGARSRTRSGGRAKTRRELRARERAASSPRAVTARRLAKGGVLAITALGVVSSANPHTLDAFGLPKSLGASSQAMGFVGGLSPDVQLPPQSAEQIAAAQQVALQHRLQQEIADATVDDAANAAIGAGGALIDVAHQQDAAEAAARQAALDRAARDAADHPGGLQGLAASMLGDYGWAPSQFQCLNQLWKRESNWNPHAMNASSGAYGLAQALPGSKMASVGSDWRTNPVTQIKWGLHYIQDRYGSPCGAWGHSQAYGWY